MKLYETPQTFADLENGDILYTTINGQIMQAKLKEHKTIYDLTINEKLAIGKNSYYIFVTPNGLEFTIDEEYFYGRTSKGYAPKMYLTLESLRKNENKLKWDYGSVSIYCQDEVNADARKRFINAVIQKYGITMHGSCYCFRLYYNSKKTKQVTELNFPTFTDFGDGDLLISHCYNEYGFLYEMLDGGYYATKEDCERNFIPNVLTFNDENDKPIKETLKKKVYVVTSDYSHPDLFGNDYLGVFENENDAHDAFAKEKLKVINSLEEDRIDYEVNYDSDELFSCSDKDGMMFRVLLTEKELS